MVGTEGETHFRVGLKATRWRQKDNVRWLEGILGGEHDATMIDAAFKIRLVGSTNGKVPVKYM